MTDPLPPADTPVPVPAPEPAVQPAPPVAASSCPRCHKPADLCVCTGLEALPTRLEVLILQHPQEQDVELGSARLLALQLAKGRVRVGLSWPNLAKALGRDAEPGRWAVLYMGPGDDVEATPKGEIRLLDRKGVTIAAAERDSVIAGLEGIILLDGSWSQAKALWWRNAWLLKLRRLVIHPDFVSAYGVLRREPRRESVSTLEAGAFALSVLEGDAALLPRLTAPFHALVARYRATRGDRPRSPLAAGKGGAGKGGRPDRRRFQRGRKPSAS